MSIIEQATRRLEELKRAGVEVAWEPAAAPAPSAPPTSAPGRPGAPHTPLHEQGYVLDPLDLEDDDVPSYAASSSARGRAAGSVAANALVRVGLRQS